MPNYEALKNTQQQLIRKALQGSLFLAPVSADPIAELTGPDSLLMELPAEWDDLGYLSNDGVQFGRDVSSSDVTSWGSVGPTRSDITADTTTTTATCQETKLLTIGLATGADLSNLVPATNGEVSIAKPSRPSAKYYRTLAVAVDEGDGGEIYVARFQPRAKPTSFAEQAFGGGDDPIAWGVTFTGYEDSTLGYTERWIFGGPGWLALLDDMGFPAPAGG